MCSQSAPLSIILRHSAVKCPKSEDSADGAIIDFMVEGDKRAEDR